MGNLYNIIQILQEPNNDNSCFLSSLHLSYLLLSKALNGRVDITVLYIYIFFSFLFKTLA